LLTTNDKNIESIFRLMGSQGINSIYFRRSKEKDI
jgi:hypothetical protein